jgi:hypothetical protein
LNTLYKLKKNVLNIMSIHIFFCIYDIILKN